MNKIAAWLLSMVIVLSTVGITMAKAYCSMPEDKACTASSCCSHCTDKCCDTEIMVYALSFDSLVSGKIQVQSVTTDLSPATVPAGCPATASTAEPSGRVPLPVHRPSLSFLQAFLN